MVLPSIWLSSKLTFKELSQSYRKIKVHMNLHMNIYIYRKWNKWHTFSPCDPAPLTLYRTAHWWYHDMEAILHYWYIVEGNRQSQMDSPQQGLVIHSADAVFVVSLNKVSNKRSECFLLRDFAAYMVSLNWNICPFNWTDMYSDHVCCSNKLPLKFCGGPGALFTIMV